MDFLAGPQKSIITRLDGIRNPKSVPFRNISGRSGFIPTLHKPHDGLRSVKLLG